MRTFITLFILCFSSLFPDQIDPPAETLEHLDAVKEAIHTKNGRLFLFTYPRSGTHWARYILRYFTQRLVLVPYKKQLLNQNHYITGLDWTKPYIYSCHIHSPDSYRFTHYEDLRIDPPNPQKDKILLIVRNPLECLIRQQKMHFGRSIDEIISYFKKHSFNLYQNLTLFEECPKENRLLIYYEDLLSNPEKEISKLLTFLDEPLDLLSDFIENIGAHMERSLRQYGKSYSKGKDLLYHSKDLTTQEREEFFHVLEKQNPKLFKKYMGWYEDLYH